MRTRLTDTEARRLTLPDGQTDLIAFDDKLTGFALRLRGNNGRCKKTWIVQYRDAARKSQKFTIGTVEELNAKKARDIAADMLASIRRGVMPHVERQRERDRAADTFGKVGALYLASAKERLKPRSFEEVRRHVEQHLAPFARTPVHDIDRRAVALRLGEIKASSGPFAANRVRATLSAMFGWAIREGIAESNPVVGTNKPAEEVSRDRVLVDAELAAIWEACRDDDYGCIVKLLMLTGQRREEVGGMLWSEIDLDRATWTLPPARTKNGREHVVPLAPAAVAILAAVPHLDGSHVFGRRGGFSGWSKAKASLDRRIAETGSPVAPWRAHDLRRTMATIMADRLGVQPHVVEAVINHVSGHRAGVAGVYNRAAYEPEKRQAAALWAEHVARIIGGAA